MSLLILWCLYVKHGSVNWVMYLMHLCEGGKPRCSKSHPAVDDTFRVVMEEWHQHECILWCLLKMWSSLPYVQLKPASKHDATTVNVPDWLHN